MSLSTADLRVADEQVINTISISIKQLNTLCSGSAEKAAAKTDDLMINYGIKLLDSTSITTKVAGMKIIIRKCKDYEAEKNKALIDEFLVKMCERGLTEKIFEKNKREELVVGARPMFSLYLKANSGK